jgi:hypothetical protein
MAREGSGKPPPTIQKITRIRRKKNHEEGKKKKKERKKRKRSHGLSVLFRMINDEGKKKVRYLCH